MQVSCLAVGSSHHVNSSKILTVWTKLSADTLSNIILSCHSVRDARNLSRVCCNCGKGTRGASLTARRTACTHTYVACEGIPDIRCPRPQESRRAPASTHCIFCGVDCVWTLRRWTACGRVLRTVRFERVLVSLRQCTVGAG
jgi:hypothetical protein